MTDSEKLAVYHILQLAVLGRYEDTIAQMIASYTLAADSRAGEFNEFVSQVNELAMDLLIDPSEIWEGLLPGPPTGDEFVTMLATTWADLNDKERKLREVEQAWSANYSDDEHEEWGKRLWEIGRILGFNKRPVMNVLGKQESGYEYMVSIIVAPGVRHDDPSDLLIFGQIMEAESPLNLAMRVAGLMERRVKDFPEEEQAAWISFGFEEHWLMTWDQAVAIIALDAAKDTIQGLAGDFPMDWDDSFQSIQDQMALAGAEYAKNRD